MKVLHAASSTDPAIGVARQMASEQAAADSLGLSWTAQFFVPADAPPGLGLQAAAPAAARVAFKREYYAWVRAQMCHHDVLVLRYLRYDPFQYLFLRGLKKPVFLVHHTLEGPQTMQEGGRLARVKGLLDDLLVRLCHARAAGLIAVTEEIQTYERSRGARSSGSYCYPNGIAFEQLDETVDARTAACPELVFVASRFVDWHGLDLLIEAASRCDRPCRVHVVGEVFDEQRAAMRLDERFVVHGTLSAEALDAILPRCTLGLGSFALFRKQMYQACTLKVREYLMAGVPVYAGHADIFDETMPWFKNGSCDLAAILDYAEQVGLTPRSTIATDARPWIDKQRLLSGLYAWLQERTGQLQDAPPTP